MTTSTDGYCSCYGPGDCTATCGVAAHLAWKPGDPWPWPHRAV